MLIWDEIIYSDGLLGMLYSRMVESVAMQGWKIDAADDSPEAQRQKTALEEFYHSVNGLQQSFGQLASAMFYGYAHLQYIEDSWGRRFEFIPQRYWVRPGVLNEWQFNPQCYIGVDTGESVEEETLVVMEHRYPILSPAARASFERNHAKITWDNHMDRYGSAPVIINAPKDASPAVMDAMERACEQLKSGASIVLPPESPAAPLNASNINENYFLSRINMADKDQVRFVMAGTLTVLNESGSGTLAGSAHTDSWNAVVSAVCSKVAEAFNTASARLYWETANRWPASTSPLTLSRRHCRRPRKSPPLRTEASVRRKRKSKKRSACRSRTRGNPCRRRRQPTGSREPPSFRPTPTNSCSR